MLDYFINKSFGCNDFQVSSVVHKMPNSINKTKIVFVCNHNSARSQMAEAIFRAQMVESFEVFSAGLKTKAIKPTVFDVMQEVGISLAGHYSKTIEDIYDGSPFDYAVLVCSSQCPATSELAKNTLHWDITSPFPERRPIEMSSSEKLMHYRSMRDQLQEQICCWLNQQDDTECRREKCA